MTPTKRLAQWTLVASALAIIGPPTGCPWANSQTLTRPVNDSQAFKTQRATNEVLGIDLRAQENSRRHHTDQYSQLRGLVLRRGEHLNFTLYLRHPYDWRYDRFRLELSFGQSPSLDKGSLVYLPVERNARGLPGSVYLPAGLAVGQWSLKVSTKVTGAASLRSFQLREPIFVIFNAWSADDDSYLASEAQRQEYVLNEAGRIYIGSTAGPVGRSWSYGQFEDPVLATMVYLLDKSELEPRERADVVLVSRAVSALVNSHDDQGLLVGNWSGNYGDGLAPWRWTGSAAIFRGYFQSGGRPVKFGQCWVFGGVTTTALRTLGIPARTISNFASAHDTDSSLTVDKYFSERGDRLTGISVDSVWNFHVWSEAWMARRDLPPGYGGWQAIDATPQETSGGKYQLGPASLQAIKEGRVEFAYDVRFVYSEVNADLVSWRADLAARFRWRQSHIDSAHVGSKIITKRVGSPDWEDIVGLYKFAEGSREAAAARAEAIRAAGLVPIFDNSRRR